jgi:hypothetical protein
MFNEAFQKAGLECVTRVERLQVAAND